jgi:hypothetical protein
LGANLSGRKEKENDETEYAETAHGRRETVAIDTKNRDR